MSDSTTTVIRDTAWIAAWDGHGQRYLRNGDVAFSGDRIVQVGGRYKGPAGRSIDGAQRFVMPGLVNIHSHPHTEPANKGVREDHGVPEMYNTGLYERSCAFSLDEPGRQAAMEMAYAELLLSGVTTVVDLSSRVEGWLDCAGRSGLRAYIGPFFADAFWKLENRHELPFDWDEARGINLGLGTDVAPHNLVEEMRLAIVLARVMAGSIRAVDTGEMFRAATVGGAAALGRDDLGRLAPGAKADIVLLDLDHPAMRPARDPLRTFVFEAADRAVREVFVDGRAVVTDGKPLHLDPERAGARLEESQARMLADAPRHDFLGRSGDAIAPYSLPL